MRRWLGRLACLLDFHKPLGMERDGLTNWSGPCQRCGMMPVGGEHERTTRNT